VGTFGAELLDGDNGPDLLDTGPITLLLRVMPKLSWSASAEVTPPISSKNEDTFVDANNWLMKSSVGPSFLL